MRLRYRNRTGSLLRACAAGVVMLVGTVVATPVASSAVSRSDMNAVTLTRARRLVAIVPPTWRSRTLDATSRAAHSPPAQKYQGLSICTDASGLKIAQGRTKIVSGIAYVTIIFVNAGSSNCYLNGTPFTQPVGAGYTPVGPPAAKYFDPGRGDYVVLDAGGGAASTSLGIANASKYYPRASCAPRKVIGVTLRFNYPADFFFRIGPGPVAVCKKITTTSITGVALGVILGP